MKALICMFLCLVGCTRNELVIKVAATPVPHAQILREIAADLKQEGIHLKIVEVDDYILPNRLLAEKQVDANFFQHRPFLQMQEQQFGYRFEVLTAVHIEPLGIYSQKIQQLDDLPHGARVAIPSDPTNGARALELLQAYHLIELTPCSQGCVSLLDISNNPLNLKIQELDAPILARALPDVACAVIPANFAIQASLNPVEEALALECQDSPYANIVVVREGDKRDALQRLKVHMTSEKVCAFLQTHYQGLLIPAF